MLHHSSTQTDERSSHGGGSSSRTGRSRRQTPTSSSQTSKSPLQTAQTSTQTGKSLSQTANSQTQTPIHGNRRSIDGSRRPTQGRRRCDAISVGKCWQFPHHGATRQWILKPCTSGRRRRGCLRVPCKDCVRPCWYWLASPPIARGLLSGAGSPGWTPPGSGGSGPAPPGH